MMLFDTLDTEDKAKEFRKDRLDKIDNGEIWGPLSEGPYCVLHWLPISEKPLFTPDTLNPVEFSRFVQIEGSRVEIPNLDGVRIYSGEKDENQEGGNSKGEKLVQRFFWNTQIFYSGALEMTIALWFHIDADGKKWLYPKDITRELWGVMSGFKECISSSSENTPVIVGASLLHALDYRFFMEHGGFFDPHAHSDRKRITLPEMLIENLDKVQDIEEIERPIFDMLWRSFGFEKCPYYDEHGKRKNSKG